MKRVLVIGSGGAGKSVLARRLHELTGLELIHLDRLYWKPGWVETPKDEWRETVAELLEGDGWIIDGNYGSTLEMRLAACDTVVYLCPPRLVCLGRALKRYYRHRGRTRPDMGPECPEKIDLEFLRWIWNFSRRDAPRIEKRLARAPERAAIVRLGSAAEVEEFLSAVEQGARGRRADP